MLPPPNLAAPRYRQACRQGLTRFARILQIWVRRLPPDRRALFPGVKIGWEASLGVNAYHYPGGNDLLEKYPNGDAHDPKTGFDKQKGFAGGLATLGYAALTVTGRRHPGAVTMADQERIVADYLGFLARVMRGIGLAREQIFTHAGGQFAPWERHYSHRIAINPDSLPGWSLYGVAPNEAGDLAASLDRAHLDDWCAAEWLAFARTADEWADAFARTLHFRRCRSLSVYNWEGIRGRPEVLEGLRRALT